MAMLLALAMHGSFAATDFLILTMVAPLYLMVVMLVLHYNDLVFLQRRALRNWANIEVSLAKRKDLIRSLEPLVKGMLKHERQLLQRLAAMRAQLSADQHDVRQAEQFLAQEARV